MGIGELFTIIFINPITNLLVGFYKLLTILQVPYSLGFAIVALTAFIKVVLHPLVAAQINSTHKMQKIAPHVSAIREKHKNDAKRQQQEMMILYKEHGVNPAAGCLPLLIQIPIFISLYNVLATAVGSNSMETIKKINDSLYFSFLKIESVWNTDFFGLSLSDNPSKIFVHNYFIIIIPLLAAGSQLILSKMMIPEISNLPKKNTSSKSDDFQSIMQTQSLYFIPAIIGFTAFSFPIGLSIYWIAFTIFGILQQYFLVGPGAAKPWLNKVSALWKKN